MAGALLQNGVGVRSLGNNNFPYNSNLSNAGNAYLMNLTSMLNAVDTSAMKQMQFQERMSNSNNAFNAMQAELNRKFQQESADKAMAFSSAEAEKNRNWQERLANTSYQRAVADMKAAGLNPILAAQNSSGAVTPSGSVGHGSSASGSSASSAGLPTGAKADFGSVFSAYASMLNTALNSATSVANAQLAADTSKSNTYLSSMPLGMKYGFYSYDMAKDAVGNGIYDTLKNSLKKYLFRPDRFYRDMAKKVGSSASRQF